MFSICIFDQVYLLGGRSSNIPLKDFWVMDLGKRIVSRNNIAPTITINLNMLMNVVDRYRYMDVTG